MNILIVEDNIWLTDLYVKWIEKVPCGTYDVSVAHDIKTAKEFLKAKHFRLIILDMILPDSSCAPVTLEKINLVSEDSPIVIISGAVNPKKCGYPANKNVAGFISKSDINIKMFHNMLCGIVYGRPVEESISGEYITDYKIPWHIKVMSKLRGEIRGWTVTKSRNEKKIAISVVSIVVCCFLLLIIGSVYAGQLRNITSMELHVAQLEALEKELMLIKGAATSIIGALVAAIIFLFRSLQASHNDRIDGLKEYSAQRQEEVKDITVALAENTQTQRSVINSIDKLANVLGEKEKN